MENIDQSIQCLKSRRIIGRNIICATRLLLLGYSQETLNLIRDVVTDRRYKQCQGSYL